MRRRLSRAEATGLLALLAVAVAVRLVRISAPFVEEWAWREADVAMIAENFYRRGFNLLYPQINWIGDEPGYVGTEFPLVPFIAALVYLPFGIHEWIGRAVSVLAFAVSLPVFYLLVREIFGPRSAAFAASIYVLVPLGIFTSRCFMPDMASLSASIVALYFFAQWLDAQTDRRLYMAAIAATSLAILLKLPAIILGVPLMYLAWARHGIGLVRQRNLWVFAGISLAPPLAWYAHAFVVALSHPPYHYFGEGGIGILPLAGYLEIAWRTVTAGLVPLVGAAMLVGLILPPRAAFGWVFHWWLIALSVFVLFAGPGNQHPWYQLPVIPVAAALAGRACDWAWLAFARGRAATAVTGGVLALFLGAVAASAYASVSSLYIPTFMPLFSVGTELDRITRSSALVVTADDGVPTALYYARRNGWHFPQASMLASEQYPVNGAEAVAELDKRRQQGATHVAFTKYTVHWVTSPEFEVVAAYLHSRYRRVRQTTEYVIFALPDAATEQAAASDADSVMDCERSTIRSSGCPAR